MGLYAGKNALFFGVAGDHSITWGITKAFQAQGARIGLSFAGEVLHVDSGYNIIGVPEPPECD